MKRTIVIISDSPLGYFVARFLDRDIARRTENQVIFLTRHREVTYFPELHSVIGKKHYTLPVDRLPHIRTRITEVKSIHLTRRQIITSKELIDYDYLVLDQTPVFSIHDIEKIARESRRLITHLQAKQKTRLTTRAMIRCSGQSANSWQLALTLKADFDRLLTNLPVQVTVDLPKNKKLRQFLIAGGLLEKTRGSLPGFSIASPSSPVSNRKIRGLTIDNEGYALADQYSRPINHPNALIVNHPHRLLQNILRTDRTQAQKLADSLKRLLDNQQPHVLEITQPALLLNNNQRHLVWLGHLVSDRLKAQLVSRVDKRSFHRLTTAE